MKKTFTLLLISLALVTAGFSASWQKEMNRAEQVHTLCASFNSGEMPLITDDLSTALSALGKYWIAQKDQGKSSPDDYSEELHQEWDGNAWVNSELTRMYYDNNGYPYESYDFTWSGSAWENSVHSTYTVTGAGLPLTILMQMWDGTNNVWVDYVKMTFTYTANNQPLTALMELFYGGVWMNAMKVTWTYNAQWLATEELTETWNMQTSTWENEQRATFTYNASNLVDTELDQLWENGAWENVDLYHHTYDAGGHLTLKLIETWINGGWVSVERFTFTYNGQWQEIEELVEQYYNGVWSNYMHYDYSYDGQGRMIYELLKEWQNKGWVNSEQTSWTYGLVGIEPPYDLGTESLAVFPNPAQAIVNVVFTLETPGRVCLKIYNTSGVLVTTLLSRNLDDGRHEQQFDIASLAPGVYSMALESHGKLTASCRLVVVK
jgi:hypothetical protein